MSVAAGYREELHPRHPMGSREGGRFAPKSVAEIQDLHQALGVEVWASESPVGITLSQIKVPAELRGQGHARAALRDILEYADRTGQVVALTVGHDPRDKGLSKAQKTEWYKRHGFVPNKGRNKDFGFTETMIRRPQAITGAGHYDPNQPRDPGGEGGGQWIRVGAGSGVTRDETGIEEKIRAYTEELYRTLAASHPDEYPYVQSEVDTQVGYMMGNYREAYEPAFSALEERLAGIPGVRLVPRLEDYKVEQLAEMGPHTGDIMVKFDVPEGQLDPDFGVWFMPPMEGEEFPEDAVRVPGGALELHDVLDISDTDFFPAGQPDLAGRYADALDDVRGIKREGYITLHRGMSAAEADAWARGEEIPTGKFFTSSHTSAMAQDIAGEFPELYSWKVAQRDVIETEPGVFQLRRPARLKDKTIESLAGAGPPPAIPLEQPPLDVAQFNRAAAEQHEEALAFEPRLAFQYEAIIRRLGRQIARRFVELATGTPALAAAAWNETLHPRDPGGEGGGQWVPKTTMLKDPSTDLPRSSWYNEGFPEGVYDMDDSVVFWPQEIGTDPERHGEPLWKAFVDENGNELAFWFADQNGKPHHDTMLELWDKTGGPTNTESFYGSSIAGYGDEVDLHDWRSMDVAQKAELDADEIYNLAADEDWHTIYDKYGLVGADVDGLEKADIQEMLTEDYLDRFKAVPRRHRKDIKDARAMFGDLTAAGVPSAWIPPTVAQLLALLLEDVTTILAGPTATNRKVFSKVVDGILRRLGMSFDVRSIIAQQILNGLAARSEGILEGIRTPVARIVANSWLNGLSVPQTADAIMEGVDGLAGWQATQLARNDLVGMSNGGSLLAAKMVNAKFPGAAGSYKQWLATEDERTRPTHNEAHGQRVPLETPFVVGGAPLDYPGDPRGPDQEVINCRCTLIYFSGPKAVTAAFVEQEHPRDPGGEAGGRFIEKGTTGVDEGQPASSNVPEAAGATLEEMLYEMGAMDLEGGEDAHPERYMKHPKSGFTVKKPGVVFQEEMPPVLDADGWGRQPPRIRDVTEGAGFKPPEGLENVKPLGYNKYQVGEPRPPAYLFRAISEAEWLGIQERGFIQSDQRMNLSQDEGTVTTLGNPSFYMPGALASDKPGRYEGRIIRIKYRDEDGWRHDRDTYVKTSQPVPISQIDMVTPKLKREVTPRPGKDWNDIGPVIRAAGAREYHRWPKGTPEEGKKGGGRFAPVTAEGVSPIVAPAPNDISPDLDENSEPDANWMTPTVLQNMNAVQGHRARVKNEVIDKLTERLKDDPNWHPEALEKWDPLWRDYEGHDDLMGSAEVDALIQTWTVSSSDGNAASLLMQQTVADEFGLDFDLAEVGKDSQQARNEVAGAPTKVIQSVRAFVQAQYAETQEYLAGHERPEYVKLSAARGELEPHYTLYRGMAFPYAEDNPFGGGMSETDYDMNPMSSWALSYDQAYSFAHADMSEGMEEFTSGAILAAKVPRSRILSTALTGVGCLPETEVVVIGAGHGGKDRAVVYSGEPGGMIPLQDTLDFRTELESGPPAKRTRAKQQAAVKKMMADAEKLKQKEIAEALGEDPEDMFG